MEAHSEGAAGRPGAKAGGARTLAQIFCLAVGLVLVVVGILGFFVNSEFAASAGVQGDELIVFEVNGWHNIVHLATGAFLLAMSPKARTAVIGLLIFGVVYLVVTVWGFVDGNDILTLVPTNVADNFLHLALALLSIAVALAAGGLAGGDRAGRTP